MLDYDEDDREYDDIDIDATVEAIRAAWKCMPDASLSELLDSVTPMPFVELKNLELIECLNEFILQHMRK